MKKIILTVVIALLFLTTGIFITPKILEKLGQDISSTEKYALRMSALISDSPNCLEFKNQIIELGKNASGMNGAFTFAIVQAKNNANKAGCSAP